MIVRVMGEGQFRLDDETIQELNAIDAQLDADIAAERDDTFREHLAQMVQLITGRGERVANDDLSPSDVILPPPDISLEELRELLGDEGLVPG